MTERKELAEGQEVRVYGTKRVPSESVPGWVRRVGRTLVEIEYAGHHGSEKFYIDSQLRTGKTYGVGYWFKTMDQVALGDRKQKALETLRQHGLGPLGWGAPEASLGVLEAAAWIVKGVSHVQLLYRENGTPADPATVAALFAKANDRPEHMG
jgi:hypothetical protein